MAQARAVVDVITAETGAHQFLEQVGFFVGTLGGTKTRQCLAAQPVADIAQAAGGFFQCFFPGRFAENAGIIRRVDIRRYCFGGIVAADQWFGQALAVMYIVEAITALDAQTVAVGGTVAAFDIENTIVLDVKSKLTTNPAVRAYRIDLAIRYFHADTIGWHQCAGRADADAVSTENARRIGQPNIELG